jgi:hypothetical protein
MCNNSAKITCIDNWSEFGGPKGEFLENFNNFKANNNADFIESDCFKVDVSKLSKFNIYMYDGNHTENSHYNALLYFLDCLDRTFIFLVDDWNWVDVRNGTRNAIKKLNLKIMYEKEIFTSDLNKPEPLNWWNGIYIVVLQKHQ